MYKIFGLSSSLFLYLLLTTSLLIISFIDLEHKIIPDIITLPGILLGLAWAFLSAQQPLGDKLLGVLLGGGIFGLVVVLSGGGMGGGDIKLGAMIGAFLGARYVLITIFMAIFCGAAVGGILLLLGKKGRKDVLPFGPFLAIGALIAILWGDVILHWYLTRNGWG